ncbi:MAG: HAD-IB family hydrolase [Pseudomonadota bacterium]
METPASHKLAIYDMDKTITHAPTWMSFLVRTARSEAPWRLALLPLAGLATAAYALKAIDRAQLKQMTQRLLLGHRLHIADARRVAGSFADRVVATGVFAGARAQIAADRAAGYRLVMATASYRFYAAAIAERLGFDDVVATEVEHLDEMLRARISGENCYGPGKLRMIEAWMAAQGIDRADTHVRFYSDHVSDAPVLGWADEGFAVNAHGPLRTLARERGWPIVDWER